MFTVQYKPEFLLVSFVSFVNISHTSLHSVYFVFAWCLHCACVSNRASILHFLSHHMQPYQIIPWVVVINVILHVYYLLILYFELPVELLQITCVWDFIFEQKYCFRFSCGFSHIQVSICEVCYINAMLYL